MADNAWNPSDKHADITLSDSDRKATTTNASWRGVRSVACWSSGKRCFEVEARTGDTQVIGVANSSESLTNYPGQSANSAGWWGSGGKIYANGSEKQTGVSFAQGDYIMIAVDRDTPSIAFYKNGSLIYTLTSNIPTGSLYVMASFVSNAAGYLNEETASMHYSKPSGFMAWFGESVYRDFLSACRGRSRMSKMFYVSGYRTFTKPGS